MIFTLMRCKSEDLGVLSLQRSFSIDTNANTYEQISKTIKSCETSEMRLLFLPHSPGVYIALILADHDKVEDMIQDSSNFDQAEYFKSL